VRRDVPSDDTVVHRTAPVTGTRAVDDEREAEHGRPSRHVRDDDRIEPDTDGAISANDPPTTFQDRERFAADEQRRDRGEPNR
jgi:hypothetical protein